MICKITLGFKNRQSAINLGTTECLDRRPVKKKYQLPCTGSIPVRTAKPFLDVCGFNDFNWGNVFVPAWPKRAFRRY